ncbi:MAG: hypothetical protein QGI83_06020 [Candidatus Latescibacteria bacterium]|jgi:hypothetical protein|nr:hypothetical protein [Candidatus Latescibacterota bacterium]
MDGRQARGFAQVLIAELVRADLRQRMLRRAVAQTWSLGDRVLVEAALDEVAEELEREGRQALAGE